MTTLPPTLALTTGLALAGAAAMGVPIVIHLLSRFRRTPQRWGAMRFLLEAFRKHRRRLRLEQLVLLVVRCLILGVLGLALAGPVLGGCAGRLASGLDASGRRVYLVIDDGLATRALGGDGQASFARLRAAALSLIDNLDPADRVALTRAGVPVQAVIDPPTLDIAAARRAVESMTPRFGRTDLPAALASVAQAVERERNVPADRTFVVVLSDLTRAALSDEVLARAPAPAVAALGSRARLAVARPAIGSPNVQVQALAPLRSLILLDPTTGAAAPLQLTLRRFDTDLGPANSTVEVALTTLEGQPLGPPVRRDARWAAGQSTVGLTLDLPLTAALEQQRGEAAGAGRGEGDPGLEDKARLEGASGGGGGGGMGAAVRVTLSHGGMVDAIAEDNAAVAALELRRSLVVGVVDQEITTSNGGDDGLLPRQWLELALSPGLGGRSLGAVELVDLPPQALDAGVQVATAAPLDAVVVLRPDLVSREGWAALKAGVLDRGGLVWVVAPPLLTPGVWGQAMTEALGLKMTVGMEPIAAAPGDDANTAAAAWTLDTAAPAPEPMRLLAADWADLLRPVRVDRRLALSTRDDATRSWLTLADGQRSAILMEGDAGRGRVLVLGVALDATWSNLPMKPLFVPLVHESLRSLLGGAGATGGEGGGPTSTGRGAVVTMTVGQRAELGPRWAGVSAIAEAAGDTGAGGSVPLTTTDAGVTSAVPIERPGLWTPVGERGGRALAVQVDAEGGDTRGHDPAQLTAYLNAIGPWTYLDEQNPIAALRVQDAGSNLGWPLLWAVAALALVETGLARWFSHAG